MAFHSLLRWKMIIYYQFWENSLKNLGVKGLNFRRVATNLQVFTHYVALTLISPKINKLHFTVKWMLIPALLPRMAPCGGPARSNHSVSSWHECQDNMVSDAVILYCRQKPELASRWFHRNCSHCEGASEVASNSHRRLVPAVVRLNWMIWRERRCLAVCRTLESPI